MGNHYFLKEKSLSMAILNSYMTNYQRVCFAPACFSHFASAQGPAPGPRAHWGWCTLDRAALCPAGSSWRMLAEKPANSMCTYEYILRIHHMHYAMMLYSSLYNLHKFKSDVSGAAHKKIMACSSWHPGWLGDFLAETPRWQPRSGCHNFTWVRTSVFRTCQREKKRGAVGI